MIVDASIITNRHGRETIEPRKTLAERLSTNKDLYVLEKEIGFGKPPSILPDCELSRFFASIAGSKNLTESVVKVLKAEGYTLTVKAKQI
mgnify:CR=1 FL=1|jgi:hypothetical protein